MKLTKLLTYRFDPNVGSLDRVFRVVSGAILTVAPWSSYFALPFWATIVVSAFGIAWFLTGVVSRCGMYYALGLSTLKLKEKPTSGP